jgi:hypothetical protein
MTDALLSSGPPRTEQKPTVSAVTLDTTAGSLVHRLTHRLDRVWPGGAFAPLVLYGVAVAITFVPLLLGAYLSPLPLLKVAEGTTRLPFLHDWNVLFLFLVSFPCLLILTATDQPMLTRSLKSVQADGTIQIADADMNALAESWHPRFLAINVTAQVLGVVIGGVIAYLNYKTYVNAPWYWIALNGKLLLAGYVFLYCIFVFYALATVYVFRNLAIALLLRDIVAHAQLHMLPLHPDKAGGLRPVGRLGLRNQYALTLFGLNVVILVFVASPYMEGNQTLAGLIIAAVVAYLVLGPLVFMGPLLPFRSGMLRNKAELMNQVALRLRVELDRLRAQLPSGQITAEDENLVERLRKIAAVIDELPVWPFDIGTLRRFLTAYILPILGTAIVPAIKWFLGLAHIHLPFFQ